MGLGDIGKYIDENHRNGNIEEEGFFDTPEMNIEETKAVPKQAKKRTWNWKKAFAQELMSGKRKETIKNKYAHLIKRFDISAKADKYLADNEYLLGYLFVNQNYFDDKFNYDSVPDRMKQTNLFSIGSVDSETIENINKSNTNDGTVDGFLASTESTRKSYQVVDKQSGLPVFNTASDINFKTLDYDRVAKVLLSNQNITLAEYNRFSSIVNKFQYLTHKIRKAMTPQSTSSVKVDQTFTEYNLKNQQLEGNTMSAIASVNINPQGVKLNDIGKIKKAQTPNVDVKEMIDKKADKNTVTLDKKAKSIKISGGTDGAKEYLNNVATAKSKKIAFNDNELLSMKNNRDGASTYLNNIDTDVNLKVDFDDEELNNLNADKNELEINEIQDEFKISNKYEFGW